MSHTLDFPNDLTSVYGPGDTSSAYSGFPASTPSASVIGSDFFNPLLQDPTSMLNSFETGNSYTAGTSADTHHNGFQRNRDPYTAVLEENIELRRRLERVEEEKRGLEAVVQTLQQALRLKNKAAGAAPSGDPRARDATPASSTSTISPNDSVSNTASPILPVDTASATTPLRKPASQPYDRPAIYPDSILWQKDDCQHNELVRPTEANPGRINMRLALRTTTGRGLDENLYSAILQFVANGARRLRSLPSPRHRKPGRGDKTVTEYRLFHPEHLDHEIALVEAEFNGIVGLCHGSWKAEELFKLALQTLKSSMPKEASEDGMALEAKGDGSSLTNTSTRKGRKQRLSTTAAAPPPPSNIGKAVTDGVESVSKGRKRRLSTTVAAPPPPSNIGKAITDGVESVNKRSRLSNPPSTTNIDLLDPRFRPPQELEARMPATTYSCFKPMSLSSDSDRDKQDDVDVGFLRLDASNIRKLADTLESQHPTLFDNLGRPLIQSLQASPHFTLAEPSAALEEFIGRIEAADPNLKGIDEDDDNEGWGHNTFTCGGITLSSTVSSFDDIGNASMATRLLAAALTTCSIARHLCFVWKIKAVHYTSDAYLAEVVKTLWCCWKQAEAPIPDEFNEDEASSQPEQRGSGPAQTIKEILMTLKCPQLTFWLKEHIEPGTKIPKTKALLVEQILLHKDCPSVEEADLLKLLKPSPKSKKSNTNP